ncbi:MAG TPA: FAD-binding oxidoreductase [Actinomycetota bacterium]|nr:FAD-binding oxidoreductase [Actinomycetota bacterium]
MSADVADLVIVGAGAIGGWASWFARENGAERVVVLERDRAGGGASSRAAGIVRAQGGIRQTVDLGRWSIGFYRSQHEVIGVDSGFTELGYLILAVSASDEREGLARVEMQRAAGLQARWVDAAEAATLNPTLSNEGHRGGSYVETDGFIDPPRNVSAYLAAMRIAGVDLRERTAFAALDISNGRVVGVRTPNGTIATERVVLTGGPTLRAVGTLAGMRVPAGGTRHQVAVTEPHEAFGVERLPMVFDLHAGLYWRLEDGGLLFGMSNPDEAPGPARTIDWPYLRKMLRRLNRFIPATRGLGLRKVWAATIDYTPDHLPIVGPAINTGGDAIGGATVASAGGHGMMWGPAVAKIAADLAIVGKTDVTDVSGLGLDRFDAEGRSSSLDPMALPFPAELPDDE